MNLIAEVARLKELEAKAARPPWRITPIEALRGEFTARVMANHTRPTNELVQTETGLLTNLRNAAPALLDVLGDFRAGDADILDGMATWFACSDNPEQFSQQIEILRRYRDMADAMEATK